MWVEVKRLCTVGVIIINNEKVQRDADFRFSKIHQFHYESIPTFYDRYLQEVYACIEAGNAFVDTEVIMEGDDAREGVNETNPRVKATRERIQVKSDKKQAMNFLKKLDRNRFTTLLDELAHDQAKGINNYSNNVMLCN